MKRKISCPYCLEETHGWRSRSGPRSLSEYCLLKGGFEEYGGPWFPVTRDGEIVA